MKRVMAALFLAMVVCLVAARSASAGYFERVEVGARGLSLASAYGAAVDDVSALHFNPGGLSLLGRGELLLTHSRPYSTSDLTANSILVGTPLAGGGIALSWHRLGVSEVVSENLLSLGFGHWVYRDDRRTIHAGAALKLASVNFDAAASPLHDFGSETQFTGDLGLLWQEGSLLRFGAVVRNLGNPEFDFIDGGQTTPMPGGVEFFGSYQWRPESAIHFGRTEVAGHSAWNYSSEIWFYEVFAIRAGVFDEEFSGGVGIRGTNVEVDAAFLTHEFLGNTYRMSVLLHLPEEGRNR